MLTRDKNNHEIISEPSDHLERRRSPSGAPWTDDPKCNVKTGATNKLRLVSGGTLAGPTSCADSECAGIVQVSC